MRYFFISFVISLEEKQLFGDSHFQTENKGFIGRNYLVDLIRNSDARYADAPITIMSIYEFKSKNDFESYKS
jgi:hypothetical protein